MAATCLGQAHWECTTSPFSGMRCEFAAARRAGVAGQRASRQSLRDHSFQSDLCGDADAAPGEKEGAMLSRPRFCPHLQVEVVPGEGVFLLSDSRQTLLRGRLYELVAPWLDGRTADDVCDRLRDKASPARGLLRAGPARAEGLFVRGGGSASRRPGRLVVVPADRPREGGAAVGGTSGRASRSFGVEAGPFLELLQSLHVRVAAEGPADVVLTDSYLRSELATCNAEALRGGRPWLLVKPCGRQIWVGPLFRPGKTGCWECLAQRLRANSPVATYLQGRNGHAGAVVHDRAARRPPCTSPGDWPPTPSPHGSSAASCPS